MSICLSELFFLPVVFEGSIFINTAESDTALPYYSFPHSFYSSIPPVPFPTNFLNFLISSKSQFYAKSKNNQSLKYF